MLQQTTVAAVKSYFTTFLARWPTVEALAAAPDAEVMQAWAGLGYYARARNLLACARVVATEHGGRFPQEEDTLRSLPGIGPYTAGAIAAIAFDRPCIAQDGNVERVAARLEALETPLPAARPAIGAVVREMLAKDRPGDFAQALMDLGATICTPRGPACVLCPLTGDCAAARRGDPEGFPVKPAKAPKPRRRGAAFVLLSNDLVALEQRPPRGLLGGMSAFPATPLTLDIDPAEALAHAPLEARWRRLPGDVTHVFTHFALDLSVFVATIPLAAAAPRNCRWAARATLDKEGLPTLMRKAAVHAELIVARPD